MIRLIPDWKRAWRFFSVQAFALAGAIPTAWLAVPEDMKATIPVDYVMYATIATVVLGVVGRITDQPNV